MELCSLHPFDETTVREFVNSVITPAGASAAGGSSRAANVAFAKRSLEEMLDGLDRGRYDLTLALGRELAADHPTFSYPGVSLTSWEARVDRGIGMLMRPPARLLIDAGFEPALARTLPIRLDMSRGMMGGAYIPARLVGDLERLLEARLERTVRRLIEAEWDGVEVLGFMFQVASYARTNGLAIFEGMDVVTPNGEIPGLPDAIVVTADKRRLDKALLARLEEAAKPPKKPGLWARLTGRGKPRNEQIGDGGES